MTSPNTESDKSIDELIGDIVSLGTDHCNNPPAPQNETEAKDQLYSLLMDVMKPVNIDLGVHGTKVVDVLTVPALAKLFNKEETSK